MRRRAPFAAALALLAAACGGAEDARPSGEPPPAASGAAPDPLTAAQQSAEGAVRRFVAAINAGDATATAAAFAPDARFDSVGRIYQGRQAIMARFLEPEVIALGGRYTVLRVVHDAQAVTFEFDFRAGTLREHFTYRCLVVDGLLVDVVGRYV